MKTTNRHEHLDGKGEGLCSVPMWQYGVPAGFCDKPAYSMHKGGKYYIDPYYGDKKYLDGSYGGYVPALACPHHGGLTKEEARERRIKELNLCDTCQHHPAECSGNPKFGTGKGNDNVYECNEYSRQ